MMDKSNERDWVDYTGWDENHDGDGCPCCDERVWDRDADQD